jgi:hypothetical protein
MFFNFFISFKKGNKNDPDFDADGYKDEDEDDDEEQLINHVNDYELVEPHQDSYADITLEDIITGPAHYQTANGPVQKYLNNVNFLRMEILR